MTERFVYSTGTISIADGESEVTGHSTAWSGRDRAGSQIWAYAGGAPVRVGTVAEVDPAGEYDNLSLPLVTAYAGADLDHADYELIDGAAIANGATQAAIYARFAAFLIQNMGLVGNTADDVDFSLVPNNSLFVDPVTHQLMQWRNGVLEDLGSGALEEIDLPGLVQQLYIDETDSAEHATSTAESAALKTWTLPANDYDWIKIEAVVRNRVEQDTQTKADFTWRFKAAGATVTGGSFINRIIADPTTGSDSGDRLTTTLSVIIAGGQTGTTALSLTAQQTVSNAAIGSLVHKFRVYGIKDSALKALVGPRDAFVLAMSLSGRPGAAEDMEGLIFTDTVTFPAGLGTSRASARAPATAAKVFPILRVSGGVETEVGHISFAIGATVGVFTAAAPIVCTAGDELNLRAPDPRDATLAGLKISLRGTR